MNKIVKVKVYKYDGTPKMRERLFMKVGTSYGGGWNYEKTRFDSRYVFFSMQGEITLRKGDYFIELAKGMYLVLKPEEYEKLK